MISNNTLYELFQKYGLPLKIVLPNYFGDFYFIMDRVSFSNHRVYGRQISHGNFYKETSYDFDTICKSFYPLSDNKKEKTKKKKLSDEDLVKIISDYVCIEKKHFYNKAELEKQFTEYELSDSQFNKNLISKVCDYLYQTENLLYYEEGMDNHFFFTKTENFKEWTNKHTKAPDFAFIDEVLDIYVYRTFNNLRCPFNNHHELVIQTLSLPDMFGKSIKFKIFNCVICDKLFTSIEAVNTQINLKEFPRIRWHIPNSYFLRRDKSELTLYGYNVQKNVLTTSERRHILSTVIDYDLIPTEKIIQILMSNINFNGRQLHMKEAKQKWEDDLNFVKNYRINEYTQIIPTQGINLIQQGHKTFYS